MIEKVELMQGNEVRRPEALPIERISHIIATLNRAGTEVNALRIANVALALHRIQSHFFYVRRGTGLIAEEVAMTADEGPTELQLYGFSRVKSLHAFYRWCKRNKDQAVIIHFFNLDAAMLGTMARAAGIRRVLVVAGNPLVKGRLSQKAVGTYRAALLVMRAVGIPLISMSRWIQTSVEAIGVIPGSSLVIHNGCDVFTIADEVAGYRRELQADGKFTMGMVARLDGIKDHMTILRAFALLRPEVRASAKIVFVGDGPLRQNLQCAAKELEIDNAVSFAGQRSDINAQLAGMDLFVFSTTDEEGFGIALIEALAAGVPIVASDVPACREVLHSGEYGELFSVGDAEGLAHLVEAHWQRWRHGLAGKVAARAVVGEEYGQVRMVERYLNAWTI